MIFEHTHFRDFLKAWLASRIAENPSYSLRAMARKLNVAPSTLSEIMSGKKGISSEKALLVAMRMNLAEQEREFFCRMVQFDSAKDPETRAVIFAKLQGEARTQKSVVNDLSVDLFKTIADWYHFPILEMTRLSDFVLTPENAARRLGISPLEAEVAIQRLERLELMERDENGRYQKTHSRLLTESKLPNESLRRFHRQMLEKAMESLTQQTPQEKVVGSETIALSQSKLPQAQAIIEDCFQRILALANESAAPDQVYHLGIPLFKLTGGKNDTKNTTH